MFQLPALPYAADALAPTMSETTLLTHHDKHHAAYVEATNKLLAEQGSPAASLEEVVRSAAAGGQQKLFNQSGQAWNHGFFWESMTPTRTDPEGGLADAITAAFGSLEELKAKFVEEGVGHFASGWAWLVSDSAGALSVVSTHDADTALVREGVTPLLVCDVWEHAYYLDYKNVRKAYLTAWFDTLANWSFAQSQWSAARADEPGWRYPSPS